MSHFVVTFHLSRQRRTVFCRGVPPFAGASAPVSGARSAPGTPTREDSDLGRLSGRAQGRP
eukprot:162919-Pyramimonas_sp.AAC.1